MFDTSHYITIHIKCERCSLRSWHSSPRVSSMWYMGETEIKCSKYWGPEVFHVLYLLKDRHLIHFWWLTSCGKDSPRWIYSLMRFDACFFLLPAGNFAGSPSDQTGSETRLPASLLSGANVAQFHLKPLPLLSVKGSVCIKNFIFWAVPATSLDALNTCQSHGKIQKMWQISAQMLHIKWVHPQIY